MRGNRRDGAAIWHTDSGKVSAGASADAAASLHHTLVKAGRGTWINRMRLRAIHREQKRFRLILDNAAELTVSWGARGPLAAGLGLSKIYHLEPTNDLYAAVFRLGLWDWSEKLEASRDCLRALVTAVPWSGLSQKVAGIPRERWRTVWVGARTSPSGGYVRLFLEGQTW